jgi:hypothetical protein
MLKKFSYFNIKKKNLFIDNSTGFYYYLNFYLNKNFFFEFFSPFYYIVILNKKFDKNVKKKIY